MLKKFKSCIDNHLNPAKKNIDSTRDNFVKPLQMIQPQAGFKLLMIIVIDTFLYQKDVDFELHLKRKPNSCSVNNNYDGLKAWETYMGIQPVFNEYKAVAYICSYLLKSADQCSQATKEAAKEAFENNLHHFETTKTTSQVYLTKRECSVQEIVYHILPELKLRRVFPAVHFVNTNVPEERTQVLLSEKELNELPDDSTNIFKRSNIDRYIDRLNALSSVGKYSALDNFC